MIRSALKLIGLFIIIAVVLFALSLVNLYSQLSRYHNYWTKQNQAQDQSNQLTYVALGDSTAQGIGASQASNGYVGLVSEYLAEKNKRPVKTINLSKSGAKINDVLTRQLPAMKALNPPEETIVTIEIGANDMISFNQDQFESEMDKLMEQSPPQTIISDIPYFGESRYKRLEPSVKVANDIMNTLAQKHDFELADLHDRMMQNGGFKTFAPDWFHPSDMAYRENWAPAFTDRL